MRKFVVHIFSYIRTVLTIEWIVSHCIHVHAYPPCRYYKQATAGKCNIPQPSIFQIEARAKWGAWNKLGNMDSQEARTAYLSLLSSLAPQWQTWRGLAAASTQAHEQQTKTEAMPSQIASSDARGVPDSEPSAINVSRSVQTFCQ